MPCRSFSEGIVVVGVLRYRLAARLHSMEMKLTRGIETDGWVER